MNVTIRIHSLLLTAMMLLICNGSAMANIDPITAQRILAGDNANGDRFGYSVSIDGDTAVIGAPFKNLIPVAGYGAVYVFTRSGGVWSQSQKIIYSGDSHFVGDDRFGWSVSLLGDVLVVGDPYDDDNGVNSGSAYVFTRSNGSWSYSAELPISDGVAYAGFGHSVSISGSTVVVGAYADDDKGGYSGSAYIFERSGANWPLQQKITASDGAQYDNFGYSVVVSGDTAAIGAPSDDDGNTNAGSVYIFTRSGTIWSQQTKLSRLDPLGPRNFGKSVSLSGNTVITGANGSGAGAAYVFTGGGAVWAQQAKLIASDAVSGDNFGLSVSIDGDIALVGSYKDDSSTGAAYIYTRSGTTWSQQSKLVPINTPGYSPYFGCAVSLSGEDAVVGAYGDAGTGAVYCYGPSYTVGGNISGLEAGNSAVLQNNSGDDLTVSTDGTFTFTTGLIDNSSYDVSVLTHPSGPNQNCTVSNSSGAIASADITDVSISCVTTYTYAVGGTITGLAAGNSVVLQNNSGDDLTADANGSFIFDTLIDDGNSYDVTVLSQPEGPNQTCTVNNGNGSSNGVDVNTVSISCVTDTYSIGGSVSGLETGNSVTLQNNSGNDLPVVADGTFTFSTKNDDGSDYAVTVLTQPDSPSQGCLVSGGSGTVSGADVTDISINCMSLKDVIVALQVLAGMSPEAPDLSTLVDIAEDGKVSMIEAITVLRELASP